MRYCIEVQYDGTAFHGSQIQGEQPTVQLALNKALTAYTGSEIQTYGASRTDEGVHALCNYYHFDTDKVLKSNAVYSLNALLPLAISVNRIAVLNDPTSNVRFDALNRTYRYRIYFKKNPFLFQKAYLFPYKMDVELLHETAALLLNYTDFESFAKKNTQTKTSICTLYQSKWQLVGEELHYIVTGNRFLRGMVRALVGTQLRVARGKITIEQFKGIIDAKNCQEADFSVPGFGLYLEHIEYPFYYSVDI